MDFEPSSYEKTSFDAILPAKELIKQIKANKPDNKPIILDIGCGSGNTAKLLSDELEYELIIGVDIDEDMIEFAKVNNKIANTEYVVQDISADWLTWNERLKKLAGKVPIIFSNYALHWISDIERTAKNISKLLSHNGIIVIDVLYCGDIYRNVSDDEREKLDQILKYPTEQEVIGRWVSAFKSAGLSQIQIKYWEPKSIYPEKYYVEEFIKIPIKWYKKFLIQTQTDINVDEMIKNLIIKDRIRKLKEKSPKGEDLIEIKQELWNFVIRK